jgi:uncharacterized protein YkwD
MTGRVECLGLLVGMLTLAANAAAAGELDRDVLAEINYARTHPADYASTLRDSGRDDDRYGDGYSSDDGALGEAIEFLERQPPLPPLRPSQALAAAAAEHVASQGPHGAVGHTGADRSSPSQRIHHQGVWSSRSAEAISYGYGNAAAVVRQLIVDDGVPGRGHRMVIFDPALRMAGAGCGAHAVYRYMCVIDFAGAPIER